MLIHLNGCNKYQLTYNNLNFSLTNCELRALKKYLSRIKPDYWEKEYENSVYEKKIPIPTTQDNFIIMINRVELFELQLLINISKSDIHNFLIDEMLAFNWN